MKGVRKVRVSGSKLTSTIVALSVCVPSPAICDGVWYMYHVLSDHARWESPQNVDTTSKRTALT